MRIRRTVYWKLSPPITMPYIDCLGAEHPELIDNTSPTPPPKAKRRESGPRMTEANIRKALGRPGCWQRGGSNQ